MKINTREDISAPIDQVFAAISDFDTIERSALRRGVDIERHSEGQPEVGTVWDAEFALRGKQRKLNIELIEFDPPNGQKLLSKAPGLEGLVTFTLVPLSKHQTRMDMNVEITAHTLSARLMVQSLKLVAGNVTKRVQNRVAAFARDIENRNNSVA